MNYYKHYIIFLCLCLIAKHFNNIKIAKHLIHKFNKIKKEMKRKKCGIFILRQKNKVEINSI